MMIKELIKTPYLTDRIEVYRNIISTQQRAREIFLESPVEVLIVSNSQTRGLGRRDSVWESPEGGLYFTYMTQYSGIKESLPARVLLEVIRAASEQGLKVNWKWPNDIILESKKLGGILVEVLGRDWIVVGIGLNLCLRPESFPEYLRDKLAVAELDRERLLADIISGFKKSLSKGGSLSPDEVSLLDSLHYISGKQITVSGIQGRVEGIDSQGGLLLKTPDGVRTVSSGTVAVQNEVAFPKEDILLIDIGNTRTTAGLMSCAGIVSRDSFSSTGNGSLCKELSAYINRLCALENVSIKSCALACVVPGLKDPVLDLLKGEKEYEVLDVDENTDCGVDIQIRNPETLGADRVCNAVAAYRIYGGSIIVVDMGTANTFDIIDARGAYIGGIIAPGAGVMLGSLSNRGAQLPNADFSYPDTSIGKDTLECMSIGIYHTLRGQIISSINALTRELKSEYKVILTGGNVNLLDKELGRKFITDQDITLKGLALIYSHKKSIKKKT